MINDKLLDKYLAHRTFLVGFENRVVLDVIRELDSAENRILADIVRSYKKLLKTGRGIGGATHFQGRGLRFKLQALARTKAALREADAGMRKSIVGALRTVAKDEATVLAEGISAIIPDNVPTLDLNKVSARNLAIMVKGVTGEDKPGSVAGVLSEMDELTAKANTRLHTALRQGIIDGASMDDMTSAVVKALDTTRNDAARLTRTMVQSVSNQAARMVHEENADVVRAEQYHATLDNDTCLICGPLDGKVFKLVDGKSTAPTPPRHPLCRCFLGPVVHHWQQLGFENPTKHVRSLFNGRPAARVDWSAWIQRSESRFQAVLGPSRAAAVIDGKIKLAGLATTTDILTLEEVGIRRRQVL